MAFCSGVGLPEEHPEATNATSKTAPASPINFEVPVSPCINLHP
jgi:hypothetical protein